MLTIKDLVANKEMTKQSMATVFGGSHGIGNYSHSHAARKVRFRAFKVIVRRGGRKYLALQRQWTITRCLYTHVGRLSYLRRVA